MMKLTPEPSPIATTAQQPDHETSIEARRNELFTLLVALNANTGERAPEVRDKLEARLSKLSFDRCLAEPVREFPLESGQA